MKKRTITIILLTILISLISISSVLAITGSIGNSRMVLRLEPGQEIEKYILVKNVNDIPLTIDLIPTGDLEENVKLKEETFILYPGEEKKAYFTIFAEEAGSYETKINVKFTPEEGNGIGLSSTIIIFSKNPDDTEPEDSEEDEEIEEDYNTLTDENASVSFGMTGHAVDQQNDLKISKTQILIVSTIILIVIFLALIIYSLNKKKKKVRRSSA